MAVWRERAAGPSAFSSRRLTVEKDRPLARARSVIDQSRSARAARRWRPWMPCSSPAPRSGSGRGATVSAGTITMVQLSMRPAASRDGTRVMRNGTRSPPASRRVGVTVKGLPAA
ncbi:hypothetical protein AEGHOMDF_2153 [Methylobacterium soli]|nr:hypothetical protein AEGHOMDF_2153 [Methylobacterium soli]